MLPKFKLRIVEGRTASELEQKVEAVVQETGGEILRSHYQKTAKNYLAFIEYSPTENPTIGVERMVESAAHHSGEDFKRFKERVVKQAEKTYLQKMLEEYKGNISHASSAAGICRYHFRNLLKKYDLYQPTEKKEEE